MKELFGGFIVMVFALALFFAGVSITAWLLSILVTFLFAINFGFWKAFAAVLLIGLLSRLVFSGIPRTKTK